eukprot:COSAG05_NODE_47_length_24712_cov_26.673844_2_plen_40_part_00
MLVSLKIRRVLEAGQASGELARPAVFSIGFTASNHNLVC